MTNYTIQDLEKMQLGFTLDAYIMHLDSLVTCPNCAKPVISNAGNNFATEHIYC